MKPPEAKAKFLFETLEPAHILEYVPEQSSSVHDFWIVRDGVRVAALEATSAHTPAMTRAYAAILDERKGGSFITGSLITQGWWIHPAPSANINRIRLHADRYLADVERDGLASFDADFQHDDAPSVAAIIADLGVRSGRTFSWTVPRQIAKGYCCVCRRICEDSRANCKHAFGGA